MSLECRTKLLTQKDPQKGTQTEKKYLVSQKSNYIAVLFQTNV